jgi:hypothetical protein
MPWTTIILGILAWTAAAFVITVVIKLIFNSMPSSQMEQLVEEQESDFISFQIKRKELDSMLKNIQGARNEIEVMIQKIDDVTGGHDEDFDER